MSFKLTIAGAGNVVVPAYLTLQQRGYKVWRESGTWYAESESAKLSFEDPVTLLALAGVAETRGAEWKASDEQIQDFLRTYGGA